MTWAYRPPPRDLEFISLDLLVPKIPDVPSDTFLSMLDPDEKDYTWEAGELIDNMKVSGDVLTVVRRRSGLGGVLIANPFAGVQETDSLCEEHSSPDYATPPTIAREIRSVMSRRFPLRGRFPSNEDSQFVPVDGLLLLIVSGGLRGHVSASLNIVSNKALLDYPGLAYLVDELKYGKTIDGFSAAYTYTTPAVAVNTN